MHIQAPGKCKRKVIHTTMCPVKCIITSLARTKALTVISKKKVEYTQNKISKEFQKKK
jgi:hypothetical protein